MKRFLRWTRWFFKDDITKRSVMKGFNENYIFYQLTKSVDDPNKAIYLYECLLKNNKMD